MATIVTGFTANQNTYRNAQQYIDLGLILLNHSRINIICFLQEEIYTRFFKQYEFPNVKFMFFEENDNYLTKMDISNFHLTTDNPSKDTLAYVRTMCHKTEWVKMAIQENPFSADNFIWIDFGIYHVFRDKERLYKALDNAVLKKYNKVRIASCINPEDFEITDNIYHTITWCFTGGVFGGNVESLNTFADAVKKKCLEIVGSRKQLMWEVNIWLLVYSIHADIFSLYRSFHDPSIIAEY